MSTKPIGPIWIDMGDAIMGMTITQVTTALNLALNRLELRAIGEIMYDVGAELEVHFHHEDASAEPQVPQTEISGVNSVAVCGICDIADCHHIRAQKDAGK